MPRQPKLVAPNSIPSDPDAFEIIRVWVGAKGTHVSLRWGVWERPAHWGGLIRELITRIAQTEAEAEGIDPNVMLHKMLDAFIADMQRVADEAAAMPAVSAATMAGANAAM